MDIYIYTYICPFFFLCFLGLDSSILLDKTKKLREEGAVERQKDRHLQLFFTTCELTPSPPFPKGRCTAGGSNPDPCTCLCILNYLRLTQHTTTWSPLYTFCAGNVTVFLEILLYYCIPWNRMAIPSVQVRIFQRNKVLNRHTWEEIYCKVLTWRLWSLTICCLYRLKAQENPLEAWEPGTQLSQLFSLFVLSWSTTLSFICKSWFPPLQK